MKKQPIDRNFPKIILFNFVFSAFLGWAIYHLVERALKCTNPTEAAPYWLLAMVCVVTVFISICPKRIKQIGSEILHRFACRFLPRSRFPKPLLSYTAARQMVAEKKYDEAIGAFK
jgi:hypothetical protein